MVSKRTKRSRNLPEWKKRVIRARAIKKIGMVPIDRDTFNEMEAEGEISCYCAPGGRFFIRRTKYAHLYGGLGGATKFMSGQEFLDALDEHDPPLAVRQHPKDPTWLRIVYARDSDRAMIKANRRALADRMAHNPGALA
jgi:hypothetical protein